MGILNMDSARQSSEREHADTDACWLSARLGTFAALALLLPLSSCNEEARASAAKRVGPDITKQTDEWITATKNLDAKTKGTTPSVSWMLASAQRASGKSTDEVATIYNKFYNGTPFDQYTSAAMTYETLLNPRVSSSDAMFEKASTFQKKPGVTPYAAFTLALACFKSGKAVEEIFDTYQLIAYEPNFPIDSDSAAAMTLELVPPTYQFTPGTQR